MSRRVTPCQCAICGVSSKTKPVRYYSAHDMILCGKHAWQLDTYGEIKDLSPLNRFDRNRYVVRDHVVYMDICDRFQTKKCEVLFDECFLDDISPRKWRITIKKGRTYITTKANEDEDTAHLTIHRFIARLAGWNIDGCEIDHMNGNTLDNRLCNLRVVTRVQQCSNLAPKHNNHTGIRGVCYSKRDDCYIVDFVYDHQRFYFKHFHTLPEAVYVRYMMESMLLDQVAVNRHYDAMKPYIDRLTEEQRNELDLYVATIICKKGDVRCA